MCALYSTQIIYIIFVYTYVFLDPKIHFLFSYTAHIPFNFILLLCLIFSLCFSLNLLFYPVTSLVWLNIEEYISKGFFLILCFHFHF